MDTPENREEVIMYQIENIHPILESWWTRTTLPSHFDEEKMGLDEELWKDALEELGKKNPDTTYRLVRETSQVILVVNYKTEGH